MRTMKMLMAALAAAWIAASATAWAVDPVDRATVVASAETTPLPPGLTTVQRTQLDAIATMLRAGDTRGAMDRWAAFSAGYFTAATKANSVSLERWLIRQGVIEQYPAVAVAADRVRFHNEQRREVAAEVRALREARSANPTPHPVAHAVLTATFTKGAPAVASRVTRTLTVAQMDAAIDQLDKQQQALGDVGQTAQIDLQNLLERHTQLVQIVSNIAKRLHDTASGIISNIR